MLKVPSYFFPVAVKPAVPQLIETKSTDHSLAVVVQPIIIHMEVQQRSGLPEAFLTTLYNNLTLSQNPTVNIVH